MSETKHEKFMRIAAARANKAEAEIRKLGQCGNTSTYEYTDEEVKKLFRHLRKSLREAEAMFKRNTERNGTFSWE